MALSVGLISVCYLQSLIYSQQLTKFVFLEIKTKIGTRIKELREIAKMSQKDLAYTSDLDRSYIASVENGQRNISMVNIFIFQE